MPLMDYGFLRNLILYRSLMIVVLLILLMALWLLQEEAASMFVFMTLDTEPL
jgi:hypothetical protein